MEWGINDKLSQNRGNNYSQRSNGNVDEWDTLTRQQQEVGKKIDNELRKRNDEQK
jgi:hypothetical protein